MARLGGSHIVVDSRRILLLFLFLVLTLAAFVAAICLGSTPIPLQSVFDALMGRPAGSNPDIDIIVSIRLPRALTAALAGAALGVAGLQMQTLLRNPLADPFVLGVTSGASLGVALVVLASGSAIGAFLSSGMGLGGGLAMVGAATLGGLAVLVPTLAVAARLRNAATVLIFGLMIGYAISAFVTVLVASASPLQLERWAAWGFGSFSAVTWTQLQIMAPVVGLGLLIALLSIKPLNALLLGETYARSMGLAAGRMRLVTMATASLLAGAVTAFCGPIGFLGIAVPHMARAMLGTSDHRLLVPATILLGAQVALVAQLVALLPGQLGVLPLNAITALIGAPVVILVILRARSGVFSG
ncbi:MAG: iron ABC transporter permease [Devosia sp.]|uniref:iron ABC transporter permease n=1 Tax=Devosia sp. TaxID=1871048 RepID=UPI0024C7BB27|nr:iron ABC transporter permease [Devosia sp.]UYN99417.1 MAG: iron ABC transporter permease [Devosia sp.]